MFVSFSSCRCLMELRRHLLVSLLPACFSLYFMFVILFLLLCNIVLNLLWCYDELCYYIIFVLVVMFVIFNLLCMYVYIILCCLVFCLSGSCVCLLLQGCKQKLTDWLKENALTIVGMDVGLILIQVTNRRENWTHLWQNVSEAWIWSHLSYFVKCD